MYCVRTCDGFYFPATASASTADDGKICTALCPGTETEAYRLARDDDEIDNAVTRKGKPYSSLPAAFAYRTSLKEGCTCGAQARTVIAALQEDPTLAPNDIVVTETGVRVFVGSSKFPYREKDFVPYRKVRRMERGLAAYLEFDRESPRSIRVTTLIGHVRRFTQERLVEGAFGQSGRRRPGVSSVTLAQRAVTR